MNDKGEEAVEYLDSRTIIYYSEILEMVKTADQPAVDKLSFIDKLNVLLVRTEAKKDEVSKMDGKRLIVFAIDRGMVGKDSVLDQSIGDITVEGSFAKAPLKVKEKKIGIYLNFYKEEDRWKIDLTSMFPSFTGAIKKLIEESGMTENELIFELLGRVSNKKIGKEVWIPTEKLK